MDHALPGLRPPEPAPRLVRRLWREGAAWDERLRTGPAPDAASPAPDPGDGGAGPQPDGDPLLAWRRLVDADDAGLFARRLAWDDLDPDRARVLLAGDPDPAQPWWWPDLRRARQRLTASVTDPDPQRWLAATAADLPAAARDVPFAHLLWPLVTAAWLDLAGTLPHEALAMLDPGAADALRVHLLRRWSWLTTRPLAARFSQDRPADATEAGTEHYARFCHRLAGTGLLPLLDEYPVLGRLLVVAGTNWQAATGELLTRLHADAGLLAGHYGCATPVRVQAVTLGQGDSHRGGRSVALVTLATPGGEPVTVVVKPKDMRIEAHYQALVADVSGRDPDVRVVAVGDRYGYASFVRHRPAGSAAELAAFYRNAGGLLALLHLLGTTDCHLENLIAVGDRLVLIDPETLFEGQVATLAGQDDPPPAAVPGPADLRASVLRVGMLPSWLRAQPTSPAVDISALGSEHPAAAPTPAPGWVGVNTDAMRWGYTAVAANPATNLPVPLGTANPLLAHLDDLVAGFERSYRDLLQPRRRTLLLAGIERFRGDRRRVVMRGTRVYGILQHRALAPQRLRTANARGTELDRLARSALLGTRPGPHWELFHAELHDLERLDIPYFDYPLGSLDVQGGDRLVPGVLTGTGLDDSLDRVRAMSPTDLAWQVALIRGSVAARGHREDGTGVGVATPRVAGPAPAAAAGDVAAAVAAILTAIEQASLRDPRGQHTWLSLAPVGDGQRVQLGLIDSGLYSGRAGLVAFLDAVAATSHDPGVARRAAVLADLAWLPLVQRLPGIQAYDRYRLVRDLGLGHSGAGGWLRLFAAPHSRTRPGGELLRGIVLDAVLAGLAERDRALDLMAGGAGVLTPLARLLPETPDDRIRPALRRVADRVAAAQDPDTGGWRSPLAGRPLNGYSHGASGLAAALLHAGVALDDERLIDAAARGFRYEHGEYDPVTGNWPDHRQFPGLPAAAGPSMVAWCHGAAGIALARAQALRLLPGHADAEQWRQDLDRAVAATVAAPPAELDYLCCGNAGRAAVLDQVAAVTGDPAAAAGSRAITAGVLARWRADGRFRLNDLGTGSTAGQAGLMTGLAGIGLHLLSTRDPGTGLDAVVA